MPMPETPIDKDDRTILAQHYIRMARQTWVIEPIAEPSAEEELPHHYLRLGIPPAYRSHTTMALLLGQFVCHSFSPLTNIKWRQVSRLQTLIQFNRRVTLLFSEPPWQAV